MTDLGSSTPILNLIHSVPPDEPIPLESIQNLSRFGLDNFSMLDRSYAWLLLTGVYSQVQSEWDKNRKEIFDSYFDFVKFNEIEDYHNKLIPNQFPSQEFNLKHNEIMNIIHGDITRMARMLFFFPQAMVDGAEPEDEDDLIYLYGIHMRRIERALYIFATMNPGYSYMQGFNELITPFYYTLLKSNFDDGNLDNIEALSFACLQRLVTTTNISEFYITQDKSTIILHKLNEFSLLQKKYLPNIYNALTKLNIEPVFYSMRWFSLLFAQEHELPSLLMIWDALFGHFHELIKYVEYVALAHMKLVENQIDPESISNTLSALQNLQIGSDQLKQLLTLANQFYDDDNKESSNFFKKLFH